MEVDDDYSEFRGSADRGRVRARRNCALAGSCRRHDGGERVSLRCRSHEDGQYERHVEDHHLRRQGAYGQRHALRIASGTHAFGRRRAEFGDRAARSGQDLSAQPEEKDLHGNDLRRTACDARESHVAAATGAGSATAGSIRCRRIAMRMGRTQSGREKVRRERNVRGLSGRAHDRRRHAGM